MRHHHRLRCWFACFILIGVLWPPQGQALEPTISGPPILNEKDLAAYKQKGRGTLAGQAFLGSPSGKAISQAGVPVHLIPVSPYTRYWFDHNVRTTGCSPNDDATAHDGLMSRQQTDCARDGLAQLLTEKRLLPYLRTTRANPTGHFWFMKVPAGRYYLVSLIEGGGSHQDERAAGIAWLTVDLEAGEKATNLVVTNCRSSLC
jgi:hypothetical protein